MNKNRSDRFFRSLLKLYPREFRSDFGPEMEEVFREQRHDAVGDGRAGIVRLWAQAVSDIFRLAPREHYDMLRQDVSFALRTMRKNARFTALTVVVLALAIGANTAIFSLVRGILLRPMPWGNDRRIVVLRQSAPGKALEDVGFSALEVADYRAQSRTLDAIAEYHNMTFTLLGHGDPERVNTGVVSSSFFSSLGVRPILGRDLSPEDDQDNASSVLILTNRYWRQSFGADPNVIGKTFEMNGRVHTVIGVLPPLPDVPDKNDVYMNVPSCPFRSSARMKSDRKMRMLAAVGVLKPGVTLEQATADLQTIAARLRQQYPEVYTPDLRFTASATQFSTMLTEHARPTLLLLLATAGFVLLIACANVSNLIISRQLRREREIAVRSALGARGARLLRQLVTESAILCLMGGGLGLALGAGLMRLLVSFASRLSPLATEVRLDPWVLGFTLALCVLTTLLFGSLPAMPSRRELWPSLTESAGLLNLGRTRRGLRLALVTAQVTASVVLIVGSGLMLRSLMKLNRVNAGLRPERVITMQVTLAFNTYNSSQKAAQFYQQVVDRVRHEPGVISASLSQALPLNDQQQSASNIQLEDRPLEHAPTFDFIVVASQYFRTLDIPLLAGREFSDSDSDHYKVTVLSQSFAKKLWPGEDPIGKRISFDGGKTWVTVVGIAGDVRQHGLKSDSTDAVYRPESELGYGNLRLLVRTAGPNPAALARLLVADVHSIDPNQPVTDIATLDEVRDESIAEARLITLLLALFSGLALVITVAGVGGVIALSVAQRTNEIGIRMALGASRATVGWMVLREGLTMVGSGLLLGLAGAMVTTQSMKSLLFAVQPNDPPTLALSSVLLIFAAVLACVIPARKATAIDPMSALRHS
ncbi:MAG TPA: ABC transporter permease [Terriglobales bacterium]|nr:ABC transporter permease [Terriglobales bacterium]